MDEPWLHILTRCEKVAAAMNHTPHSATREVVKSLGFAGALYAFSSGVTLLLRVVLAAIDDPELADTGDYWGAETESDDSVDTTSSYAWSSGESLDDGSE